MSLAAAIAKDRDQPAKIRIGMITSTDPLRVQIQATDFVDVGFLSPYAPVVGDVVAVAGQSSVAASGSSWLILGRIDTLVPATSVSVQNFVQTIFTTASVVYTTAGAGICGVAFTAPPSGKILLLWVAELNHGTSFLLVSPQIALGSTPGSGSVFLAASDDRTCRNDATSAARFGSSDLISGLTPGTVYNVALYHRVGAGTGTIGRRNVVISPTV